MWLLDVRVVAILLSVVIAVLFLRYLVTGEIPRTRSWPACNRWDQPVQYCLVLGYHIFFVGLLLWGAFHYANTQAAKQHHLHATTPTTPARVSSWSQSNPPGYPKGNAH